MANQTDFLETLYEEFDTDGILGSSSFQMIVDLAREGDYQTAAEVLEALVNDGHTDLACELYREICMSSTASSALDAPDSMIACRLFEELLYNGSIAQAVELFGEMVQSGANTDDPEVLLLVEKLMDVGHLDWLVMLCSNLLDAGSPSFAILMAQMLDCGLLPHATRICVELVQDPSKAFYHTQKLRAIRAELMDAGFEHCSSALCTQVLHAMEIPYMQPTGPLNIAQDSPASQLSAFSHEAHRPSVMEAY